MEKLIALKQSYKALVDAGRVKNKKEFAALLDRDYSGVISAFGGNAKFLTDALVSQAAALVSGISDAPPSNFRVCLLPVEAHAGSLTDFAETVQDYECETVVSPIRGASFAIQVTGDSMSPAFPNGCKVLIQRVNEEAFIEWGRVYVLDTDNGIIIKQIRKSSSPDCVICCSLNPSPEYEPFEVERRYIRGWFRVLMEMTLV